MLSWRSFPWLYPWLLVLLFVPHLPGCALVREVASSSYGHYASWRPSDPQREKAPYGIEAICVRATLNYLIPVDGGVVLVDAGYEESGERLKEAIGERPLLGILLTHAHIDHRLAVHQFDVPVYVGAEDAPWLTRSDAKMAFWPRAGRLFLGRPPAPKMVQSVQDGDQIEIGGALFYAIHLPGHTPGSTAWRFQDVLFTGDAVQAPYDDGVYPAPDTVTADLKQAWHSMERLVQEPFSLAFDGHHGRIDHAKEKVMAAVKNGKQDGFPAVPTDTPRGCADSRVRPSETSKGNQQ